MISIFVTIVLIINGPINAIYVFLPMALAFIQVFIFNPFFKNKEIEVMEKESELLDVENDYQFKMKSGEAHNIAYHLGLSKNMYSYVEIAILLLVIVTVMTLTKTTNIIYIIFNICVTFFLKQTFSRLFEYSSKYDEYTFAKAKILNSIKEESNNW